jgi:hypothetical protein
MLLRRLFARESRPLLRPLFWLSVIAVATSIVAKTWMRWMDPQIDFGWQIYLPWRLSLGEHLGRDYVHAYGPLSAYLNAAWLKLFGVSVQTLVIANLAVYAVIVWLLYQVLRRGFGFAGAALGTLVGIVVFGFGNHSWVPNYTYAAPYAHEATHGVALLMVLLWLLVRPSSAARPRGWWPGLVFGLICLTKVEVVFGAALVSAAAAGLLRAGGNSWRDAFRWLGELLAGALVVLTAAWALLSSVTDPSTGLRVVCSGFLAPLLYPAYTLDPHSLAIMGVDQPAGNFRMLLLVGIVSVGYIAVLTATVRAAAGGVPSGLKSITGIGLSVGLVVAAALLLPGLAIRAGRAFPLLLSVAGAVTVLQAVRKFQTSGRLSARTNAQLLLWIAAVAMMARVMLAPKVYHYGFYLTMLGGVWLTAFITSEWPRLSLPRSPWRVMLGAQLTLTTGLAALLLLGDSLQHYDVRTHPMGEARDRIQGFAPSFLDAHAKIEGARRFLEANTAKDATVLVIPEGVMLNYWTRRKHPLRIADALPPTLRLHAGPVLHALQATPPDYLVLMTRMAADPYQPFGSESESDRNTLQWISLNYTQVADAGVDPMLPFNGKDFGIRILRRNPTDLVAAAGPAATN